MEKISWTDYVRNEQVLQTVMEKGESYVQQKGRKAIWIGHILLRNYVLKHLIEGEIEGTGRG